MTRETVAEFLGLLTIFSPEWALLLLVAGILSWQSPKIVREVFAGTRGLITARRQSRK
jgi:hypothetical protein